ncbi:MAG: tetratricopeptide repeat protein [Vulcanimicrobiota bacterium]
MSWDEPCPDCTIQDGSVVWCEKCLADNPYRTNLIDQPKIGRETNIMESPFATGCPNCEIVLGSLVPCQQCLAKGVQPGPASEENRTRTVPVQLEDFEVPESGPAPWTISAPDRWLGGIMITVSAMFVLYLLLALTVQPATTRPMPLQALKVGGVAAQAGPPRGPDSKGKQLLREGARLINEGRIADGESLVHQSIDALQREGAPDQTLAASHFWLAVAYERQGDSEKARRSLQTATSLDPDNPSYQLARITSHRKAAEQSREQSIKDVHAVAEQAIQAIGQGHHAEGEAALRAVLQDYETLEAPPQLKAQAHAFLGAALAAQEKKAEARRELEAAMRLDPQPRYQQGLDALNPDDA